MKMCVYNIRLELQMKIEERDVASYLHRKGMKLTAIVSELAVIYQEDAFDENRVKYWLHEIKLHRYDLSDRPSSGRPPLADIDARILQVLEAEPWFSVRMIAEFLKVPASKVHLHLTPSLNMKSQHFKWVPHFLDDDLRAKRLEGARQLLGILQAQGRCHFQNLITRDERWVDLDMKPGTIWLPADAELLVRVKGTIASEKRMLIVFWRIHGIAHSCWLPKDRKLDSSFFCEEVLRPLAQKWGQIPKVRKL
jgi:transposase